MTQDIFNDFLVQCDEEIIVEKQKIHPMIDNYMLHSNLSKLDCDQVEYFLSKSISDLQPHE